MSWDKNGASILFVVLQNRLRERGLGMDCEARDTLREVLQDVRGVMEILIVLEEAGMGTVPENIFPLIENVLQKAAHQLDVIIEKIETERGGEK